MTPRVEQKGLRTVVAILLPNLRGGGGEHAAVKLANELAGSSVEGVEGTLVPLKVDLLLFKAEGEYLGSVSPGVRIVALGASRALTAMLGAIRYLLRERPRALLSIHDHVTVTALLSRKAARTLGMLLPGGAPPTRLVASVQRAVSAHMRQARRTHDRGEKLRLLPWLMRFTYPWADGVAAVSEGAANDLAATIGLPREKISVIHNPVLDETKLPMLLQEPVPHPWLLPGRPPVVVGVGRFYAQKDFVTLIRAFAAVREKREARLLLFGEGPLRSAYQALIRELHLEKDAALPGFTDRPLSAMAHAGVFVLSSVWEGLPTVLIEAVAAGVPVVSTRCPTGPDEILENGRYGALVDVGNVDQMASAILTALNERRCLPPAAFIERFSVRKATVEYKRILLGEEDTCAA